MEMYNIQSVVIIGMISVPSLREDAQKHYAFVELPPLPGHACCLDWHPSKEYAAICLLFNFLSRTQEHNED